MNSAAPDASPIPGLAPDEFLSLARPAPAVATAAVDVLRRLFPAPAR